MLDVLNEVISWCNSHPSELVIFDINSCGGDAGCYEASLSLVQSLGLYSVTDCSVLNFLTYSGARSAGMLSSGGSLVVIFDCLEMLYDDKINCYGKDFYCYDEKTKNIPFGHMSEYLHNCTVSVPVNDGRLWSPQVQSFYVNSFRFLIIPNVRRPCGSLQPRMLSKEHSVTAPCSSMKADPALTTGFTIPF